MISAIQSNRLPQRALETLSALKEHALARQFTAPAVASELGIPYLDLQQHFAWLTDQGYLQSANGTCAYTLTDKGRRESGEEEENDDITRDA